MYLTADFGASNTRVASSFDLKTFKRIEKFKTKESFSEQVALLNNVFLDLSSGQHIDGICIGIAGKLDFKSKKVVKAVNYSPLNGKRFDEIVERRVSTHEVVIENDALLAGLGESVFGAGKKFNVVAYITLSTGVGGVRVEKTGNKGLLYFPSEVGHHIILEDGRFNEKSGLFGTLESYASGPSFKDIFGMNPEECSDSEVWDIYAKHLSTGVTNIIALWDPEVIVFGGGLSNQFDRFYSSLVKYLNKQKFFQTPRLEKASLSDESGLYGGLVRLGKL